MAFADLFVLSCRMFEGFRHLRNQVGCELVSLGRMSFHRIQLMCPCRQGGALERARGQGRSVADAQRTDLLRFAVVIFLAQSAKLGGVFLLDSTALAIELLNFFQP